MDPRPNVPRQFHRGREQPFTAANVEQLRLRLGRDTLEGKPATPPRQRTLRVREAGRRLLQLMGVLKSAPK